MRGEVGNALGGRALQGVGSPKAGVSCFPGEAPGTEMTWDHLPKEVRRLETSRSAALTSWPSLRLSLLGFFYRKGLQLFL